MARRSCFALIALSALALFLAGCTSVKQNEEEVTIVALEDLVALSTNLTFFGVEEPRLTELELTIETGGKLISAAIGGTPAPSEPSTLGILPATTRWQVMKPDGIGKSNYRFDEQRFPRQVGHTGYSVVVFVVYRRPGNEVVIGALQHWVGSPVVGTTPLDKDDFDPLPL